VLNKTNELIAAGVKEQDIAEWITKGIDPHGVGGTSKSVYKCAFQFLDRIKLGKMLLGDQPLDSMISLGSMVETPA